MPSFPYTVTWIKSVSWAVADLDASKRWMGGYLGQQIDYL